LNKKRPIGSACAVEAKLTEGLQTMTNLACHHVQPAHVAALLAAGLQPGENDEAWWDLWLTEKSEATPSLEIDMEHNHHPRRPELWESHMHNKNTRARRRYDKARDKRHFH
jgi:hypothetical protein